MTAALQPALSGKTSRQRRKAARPDEIVAAALDVFAEKGFASAKIDEIARRAGVAKGTVYRYFDTKEGLFRAVARASFDKHVSSDGELGAVGDRPLEVEVSRLLAHAAQLLADGQLTGIARMVIGEARAFPDLARIWHDDVAARLLGTIAGLIERAQARGEVRDGDPRIYALSIVGSLLTGALFHEMFGATGADLPDLHAISRQHALTVLHGLLTPDATTLISPPKE